MYRFDEILLTEHQQEFGQYMSQEFCKNSTRYAGIMVSQPTPTFSA